MHECFVENSGSQPLLYVFSQIFEADKNLNFVHNLTILEKDYDDSQKKSFLKFWSLNAESIVGEDCRLSNKSEGVSTKSSERNPICENSMGTDDKSSEDNEFWQQYYEKIYIEQYQVYSFIFYEYYKYLHKSLEPKEIELEEVKENNLIAAHNNSILSEFEQLRLLGLPTAFGKDPKQRGKTLSWNKKLHHIYSGFFSDEEEYDAKMNTLCKPELLVENKIEPGEKAEDDSHVHNIKKKVLVKKKQNRKLRNVPEFLLESKGMLKYWRKRFSLFSRYDEGVRLDCESWFSVTPEKIAVHLADRLSCDFIIDAFCGCGGNAIQFARTCKRVVAIDIDPMKLNMARHNATIYGVADRIDFVLGDFLQIDGNVRFRSDVIFLSPPWGGPQYKKKTDYDIEKYLQPAGASKLMEIAKTFSENVVLYLPRNSHMKQVVKLAGEGKRCEVEHNYLDSRLVAISAIYGDSLINVKNL